MHASVRCVYVCMLKLADISKMELGVLVYNKTKQVRPALCMICHCMHSNAMFAWFRNTTLLPGLPCLVPIFFAFTIIYRSESVLPAHAKSLGTRQVNTKRRVKILSSQILLMPRNEAIRNILVHTQNLLSTKSNIT